MSQMFSNALAGGNFCLSKATLAAGTTTTISNTGTTVYAIKGQAYSKSAMTNAATPTTDAGTGKAFVPLTAGKSCIFVVGFDAAGNVGVFQGPLVNGADVTGKLSAVQFPNVLDTHTAVGYLYAQAGSTLSGTWTFGTNNLSGVTGMTYTFRDLIAIPPRPITA